MLQQEAKSGTTSDRQETEMEPNELPRTPYAIAAFILTAVISTYSLLFKLWDNSDFPETFAHPAYWLLLGLILLVGGLWALLVSQKRRWFDFVLVEVLFLAAAVTFVFSVYVHRKVRPSERVFTVALFKFTDHTAARDVGLSLRDNIQRELETNYRDQILILARDREIKGETREERAVQASTWGGRGSGCHLAVWVEIFMDKNGQDYVVNLHWTRVFPLGTPVNHEEVKSFDRVDQSFVASSAGSKGAVDENGISNVVNSIVLLYGIATYDKADYDTTLRILSPLKNVWSEFISGQAAYEKAQHSTQTIELLRQAEAHLRQAIELDSDNKILGGVGYAALGKIHHDRVAMNLTETLEDEARSGIVAYSKAAELMKAGGELQNYALMLVNQANLLLGMSAWNESTLAKTRTVDEAESKIREALKNINTTSAFYSDAQRILGDIYYERGEYEKAIGAYETALHSEPTKLAKNANTLTALGRAQTGHAWRLRDRKLHEEGLLNFRRASEICQSMTFPFECYLAHMNAGAASINWANELKPGSSQWLTDMEMAITEFEASGQFVSRTEQAPLFARSRQRVALANITRAATEKGEARLKFLNTGLSAITEGIEALYAVGSGTRQLYIERAHCYDLLRFSSNDIHAKNEYLRLANIDREAAKRGQDNNVLAPSPQNERPAQRVSR